MFDLFISETKKVAVFKYDFITDAILAITNGWKLIVF